MTDEKGHGNEGFNDPCCDTGGSAPKKMGALEMLACAAVFLGVLILICELLAMWTGIGTTLGWAAGEHYQIFMSPPIDIDLVYLEGISLQMWWIILVLAITASAVLLLYKSKDVFRKGSVDDGTIKNSPLYWTMVCFVTTTIISFIVSLLSMGAGSGITPPEGLPGGIDPEGLFLYANAAVWEEIEFRVLYMGVPMMLVALYLKKSNWWKCLFGGFGISRLSVILIVVSAIIFGFAHYEAWGLMKVVAVTLGGIVMGYMFARFGLFATIVMHFLTDYMSTLDVIPGLGVIVSMLILVVGLVCLVYLLDCLRRNLDFWKRIPNLMPEEDQ